jgi:hypothetical protein
MPRTNPPAESPTRPEDSPFAWFSELLLAHDRNDATRASNAQKQLDRLGWWVTPFGPHRRKARREALAR